MRADPGRRLVSLFVSALVLGCATHTAPHGFLPDPLEAGSSVYGGWIEVTFETSAGTRQVAGELISATADSLWVLDASGGGTVVATSAVRSGQLVGYDSEVGKVGTGTALGVLSTASNGLFAIFTAPAWVIVGSLAARAQSRLPIEEIPAAWEDLASFSRFPQGLPQGVRLSGLRPKPAGAAR